MILVVISIVDLYYQADYYSLLSERLLHFFFSLDKHRAREGVNKCASEALHPPVHLQMLAAMVWWV